MSFSPQASATPVVDFSFQKFGRGHWCILTILVKAHKIFSTAGRPARLLVKALRKPHTKTKQSKTMQEHKLVRQGLAPLTFVGEIIGKGEIGNEQSGVTIRIYRTKGNLYVGEIERRNRNSRTPYIDDVPPYRNAAHFSSPAEVINWLKEDEETLGKASQDAVEKACENDKEFAAAWVERIE